MTAVLLGTAATGLGPSIPQALLRPGRADGSIRLLEDISAGSRPWSDVLAEASGLAAVIEDSTASGATVAIAGTTTLDLVVGIAAAWLSGRPVCILPLPHRGATLEQFAAATGTRLKLVDAGVVLHDDMLRDAVTGVDGIPALSLTHAIACGRGRSAPRAVPDPSDPAIMQLTSGSTGTPRVVVVSHHAVLQNIDAIWRRAAFTPDDVVCSWLPLFHDMGLMMLMASMFSGSDFWLAPTQVFQGSPGSWVQWLSDSRATITGGPNFAYAVASRTLRSRHGLNLSRLRVAINGGEVIDPQALRGFFGAGRDHGLSVSAASCCFGLAEAVCAVTMPRSGDGLGTDHVDPDILSARGIVVPLSGGGKELCRLGPPLDTVQLRILRDGVLTDEELVVGEVQVAATHLFSGYAADQAATDAVMTADGWMSTGDLGYLNNKELVLCGRQKDVLIVGGRNISPEDVERCAASVPGVRAGNVVAFAPEDGASGYVIVAEYRGDAPEQARREIVARSLAAEGAAPTDVLFLRPGALPKTSSGKLQRSACRTAHLHGSLRDSI
ncbi:MAG: AMP-binding protein [Actinobacteria bacterium]|nr:AMP-binding protein [Actinomycetota bacterium]